MAPLTILLGAALLISLLAAAFDLKTGEIPNWLTLWPLGGAIVGHFVLGFRAGHGFVAGLTAAGFSIAGALICGAVPYLLYRVDAIGGGDVKLLLAIGAIFPFPFGLEAEFYAFIAAAIFAPAWLAWRGKLLQTLGNTLSLVANPFRAKAKRREVTPEMMTWFRFAPAIFVGTLVGILFHLHELKR